MVIMLIITVALVSCDKVQILDNTNNQVSYEKMSLAEFASSVESKEEIAFFKNHNIVDNTDVYENLFKGAFDSGSLKSELVIFRLEIKFKWHGSGCVVPIGICIIIPSPMADAMNAEAMIFEENLIVFPTTEDNGLTSDGYLPIFEDIYVDENTVIKAGIYSAYFDAKKNRFTAVALDLK